MASTPRERTEEWRTADKPDWLGQLRAVAEAEVYAVDGSAYFSRPGPRVIDGVALLAEIFDARGFGRQLPEGAWQRLDG